MHIVLVYRYYNDGIVYYNLTFCTNSNDRFGFIFSISNIDKIYKILL